MPDSASAMRENHERASNGANAQEIHYRQISQRIPCDVAVDYAGLVTPYSNPSKPFHRWFHMKEAFSAGLLGQVVKDCGFDDVSRGLRILDPFSGSATTAISAAELDPIPELWGVESNPFLYLLSSVTHKAMQQTPTGILSLAEAVTRRADARTVTSERFVRPALSTYKNKKYFHQAELRRLLALVDELERLAPIGENLSVDLLRIAVAASAEPVSNLRRDGRALRYCPDKARLHAYEEFLRRAHVIAEDVASCRMSAKGGQFLGDGRRLDCLPGDLVFDLVLFSPPYPNNIDYTEVYKLEAWMLGMIASREQFREQRLRTLHSHPSIRREVPSSHTEDIVGLITPVLDSVEPGRYSAALIEMIQGYMVDLVSLFRSLANRVRPGGHVVCAIGNSVHGPPGAGVIIAADVLVMAAADIAGLAPQRIAIARNLTRRSHSSPLLRESVCFIQREES